MSKKRVNKLSALVLLALLITVGYACGCGGHHGNENEHQHVHHDHHHDHHDHHHDHQHDHHDHHNHDNHNHDNHNHDNHNHDNHNHDNHNHEQYLQNDEVPHDQSPHQTHQQQTSQTHTHSKQPQLQMIQDKPRLLQTLKLTPITIFFYGTTSTPQYQQFTKVIPAYNDQFFSKIPTQIQFAYISSEKFKLARPNPSLSIYRNINNGEWLMYRGIFEKTQMLNWITGNVVDPLKELTGQELDEFFVQGKKGFILLDFGQFYLLKPKIMISQFCQKFQLSCGKVSHTNKALNMIIQLMRAQNQPGIPKLSYWNPKTQQLQIYTKDVGHITETELMQLYSGHESVIPYESELDVAKVIHPETEIIEVKENDVGSQL